MGIMDAKQEWEAIFGDRAIEMLERNNSDLAHALAACMEWLGIEHGYVGEYHVYMTENGGAEAIRVDIENDCKRIPSVIEEVRKASDDRAQKGRLY